MSRNVQGSGRHACSEKADLSLAIASGGTGGHFYPALAVAGEFRRRGGRVVFLVAGHHAQAHLACAQELGFEAVSVPAVRLPRTLGQTMLFPVRLAGAVLASWKVLRTARPAVVLAMGSFAAAPVGLAAVLMRLRLVLHEGNTIVGKANRLLSRWAEALALSLPPAPGQRTRCRQVVTGLPLRESLVNASAETPERARLYQMYGLESSRRTLLVFGGSQGAKRMNDVMGEAAAELARRLPDVQVIHLTGQADNRELERVYREAGVPVAVRTSEARIQNCYHLADLVISRAGAATISELVLFRKPAILVPLPSAADDHQSANARMAQEAGLALHLPQEDLRPTRLLDLLEDWSRNRGPLHDLRPNGQLGSRPDAAAAVVDLLVENVLAE